MVDIQIATEIMFRVLKHGFRKLVFLAGDKDFVSMLSFLKREIPDLEICIVGFQGSMAMDLKDSGIHISMIAPGFVKTPATDVNEFAMPFIIQAEEAARRIANGLAKNKTHISFPKRFAFLLRFFNLLPRAYYVKFAGRFMGR